MASRLGSPLACQMGLAFPGEGRWNLLRMYGVITKIYTRQAVEYNPVSRLLHARSHRPEENQGMHGDSACPFPAPLPAYGSDISPPPRVNIAAVPVPGVRPVFFLAASSCFSASMLLTYDSMSSTGNISIDLLGAMMAISIFLAPVCTTSNRDLTVSLIVSSRSMSSLWLRSRNSRTVLLDLPIAFAFLGLN